MKVYVIGIASDQKDQAKAVEAFQAQGLDAEAFRGVHGRQDGVKPEDHLSRFALFKSRLAKRRTTHWDMPLKDPRGAIGCSLSHKKVWETIVEKKLPYALVCEADARPKSELTKRLDAAVKHQNDWDIVMMGHRSIKHYLKGTGLKDEPEGFKSGKMETFGTHGYLLSQKGAQTLLDNFYPIENQTDGYLIMLIYLDILKAWYDPKRSVTYRHGSKTSTQTGKDKHLNYCHGGSIASTPEFIGILVALSVVFLVAIVFIVLYLRSRKSRSNIR